MYRKVLIVLVQHSVKIWLAVQHSVKIATSWLDENWKASEKAISNIIMSCSVNERWWKVFICSFNYSLLMLSEKLLIRWWIDNCTPLPYIGHRHLLVVSMASQVAQPILCYLLTLKCCWVNQLFIQGHMLLSRQKAGPGLWNESRRDSMHKHIIHNNVKHILWFRVQLMDFI